MPDLLEDAELCTICWDAPVVDRARCSDCRAFFLRNGADPVTPRQDPKLSAIEALRITQALAAQATTEWLMAPDSRDDLLTFSDLLRRPAWHRQAACRGVDPGLFFPDRGSRRQRRPCPTARGAWSHQSASTRPCRSPQRRECGAGRRGGSARAAVCDAAWRRGARDPTVGRNKSTLWLEGQQMSIEWLSNIDGVRVSEVLLADGWHSIDVPSFTVSPLDESFSFDETVSHTHTSSRTRVVVGTLSAVLAVSYGD